LGCGISIALERMARVEVSKSSVREYIVFSLEMFGGKTSREFPRPF
jgi:hypothetical protein